MEQLGETFLNWVLPFGLGCLLLSLALTIYRILRGPTLADRVVALDMLALLGIAVIGIIAVKTEEYAYLDVAIALALVGFLATVAFARYIDRNSIEPAKDTLPGRKEDNA